MIDNNNHENLYKYGNGRNVLISYIDQVEPCPFHWHLYSEVIYILNGELSINVDGAPYHLTGGNIIFISPCELHSILPEQSTQTMLLQYDPSILMQFPSIAEHNLTIQQHIKTLSSSENPLLFESLRALLYNVYDLQKDDSEQTADPFYDVNQYMLICQMATLLFSCEKQLSKPILEKIPVRPRKAMQSILEACSYISRNYTDDITLTQLAERAGMSKFYFSRMFEQYTNSNFNTYLAKCRLDNAKRLLANKDNKITDIAFQSGFGSLATFNRIFLKYEGMSPTDFRKLHNVN